MKGAIFIITILLAATFGFARYSEAEFTQTHEAEILQLSIAAVYGILVLVAIFSQSFLLFCLEVAGMAIGLGVGRVAASLYDKSDARSGSGDSAKMPDSVF